TLYRERFAGTHVHISKDQWPNAGKREARPQRVLEEPLSAQKSPVVDNTTPTIAERAKLIAIARERGARVIGYYFDVTTRAAVARNANRSGREKAANVAIFGVATKLEPPTFAEGFDQLFRVTIAEDR